MDNEIDNTKDKLNKRGNPAFYKGMESNNPDGRPKGAKNYLTLIEESLKKEAEKAKCTYWDKLAQWAMTNPVAGYALLKKFLPDKTATEISGIDEINFNVNHVGNGNKD